MRAPRIVNYGAGVDSTAMLLGMRERGWAAPDLVVFANTGSEKPETIAYLDVMDDWLRAVGWPTVTRLAYEPVRAPYRTLAGLCVANETLPSLAFGGHSCSLRFKVEVIDKYLNKTYLPVECRIGKSRTTVGEDGKKRVVFEETLVKSTKYIGYDAGKSDIRRANRSKKEDHQFVYTYPLQEWGWERQECVRVIAAAGLPVPLKSACFMCPASKPWELLWLAARHPDLFLQAIAIEDGARAGKHGLGTCAGLGRSWSWRAWAEAEGVLRGTEIAMPAAELLRRADLDKPAYEAHDTRPCMMEDAV